jgi:hypothetical protein
MKMISEGWHVAFCEMPCENDFMKGRIDDVIERPNCILAVEYSSSSSPRGEKLLDTAISAGFLKYEFGLDTEAILVSNGEVTSLPHDFIERTWKMVESFPKLINLDDEVLLQYANIASGLCNFCDNNYCKGSAPMGL